MASPPLTRESDILKAALDVLVKRLPTGWSVDLQFEPNLGPYRADAIVTIGAPTGKSGTLVAEARRSLVTKDLPSMVAQAESYLVAEAASSDIRSGKPMIVARYLAQPLREWLDERDVAYADATGNLRVGLDEPALFIRDVGAQKDPWRGPGRPKGNLTGASAARVVRALVDFQPPFTVPQLIKLAGTSSGTTYRAVDFIDEQALLTRSEDGRIQDVQWRALLERWARDSGFTRSKDLRTYLAPRGLDDLLTRLTGVSKDGPGIRYAVTGSFAAQKWAPYAPAKNAMIYAESPQELALMTGLRAVDAGANVLIARPESDAVYERTERLDRVEIVAPAQAAADLLNAPGRGPEEGRVLLDWMEKNEREWRR